MLRYGQRVEKYVGTVTDYDAIDQFLSDGSRFIITNLPRPYLETVATAHNVGPSGLPVSNIKVAFVRRDGLAAQELHPQFAKLATFAGSRWYANENRPVYYISSSRAYVLPHGGVAVLYGLQMPTISHLDFYSTLPQELDLVVVLYASVQYMILKMAAAITDLTQVTFSLPAQPSGVVIPNYLLSAATYPDLSVEYVRLHQYLTTEEDLELARGQVERMKLMIEDWRVQLEKALKEWEVQRTGYVDQMAEQKISIDAWTAAVQAAIQEFSGNIGKATSALNALAQSMAQIRLEYSTQLALLGITQPQEAKS